MPLPAVRRPRSARRKGGASAPATPASRAAASASRVAASTASVGSGAGLAPRPQPEASPSAFAVRAEPGRGLGGGVDAERRAVRRAVDAGRAEREEGREVARAERGDGHAARLEGLERLGHVEDGLDAAADDEHLRPAQLVQVGAHVPPAWNSHFAATASA